VYTPAGLAAFVVDRAVGVSDGWRTGSWLDPACGDGALLTAVVDHLAEVTSGRELAQFVEDRLFGIDIDPAACRQARERVVAAVERRGGPQPAGYFETNIKAADFLEIDPAAERRWDVIVANPPYVSAVHLDEARKQRYATRFGSAWGRLDLYGLFLEQSLRLLRDGGGLSFITPDKWLTAESSRPLRALVRAHHRVRTIDRFERHDLFRGVATVPCVTAITAGEHGREAMLRWWDVDREGRPIPSGTLEAVELTPDGAAWYPLAAPHRGPAVPVGHLVERISVGIATGCDRCFVVDQEQATTIEQELLRPVLRGRDIGDDEIADAGRWLLLPYTFDARGESARLVDIDDYPGARAHLASHRVALEARHCVRKWRKRWYDLHDPVLIDLAGRPKIVLPDVAYEPRFAFDAGERVPLHSAYYRLPRADAPLSPEQLLAALRSPTVATELRRRAPTAKNGYRRFQARVLRELPIPLAGADTIARALADAA
jgi:adenine-specific DNA-methyltransferase